ncbi:endonuclease domain-containing protein [Leifsonia sp. NPDC058194]|uniref:endonuclease domain-containing protein n=1 Tax=Leifsonia sp. NPDC058194 TaxID=3346374 RepID=UPI0036DDD678
MDVVQPIGHHGLPLADPVETWVQLSSMLTVEDLVVAGDALVRRDGPLADLPTLRSAVEGAAGRPGIRRLRVALPLVRARTDSPMETVLRLAIVRSGLPEPNVNHVIHAADRNYHADLAYPWARLAIEYDGEQHRLDRRQYQADIDRLWSIEAAGWQIVRVNRTHLADGAESAITRIRAALASSRRDTSSATGR